MSPTGRAALDLLDRPGIQPSGRLPKSSLRRAALALAADPAQRCAGEGAQGLTVRLAASADEIRRAQALRYQVFYAEGAAIADERTRALARDIDGFDAVCDHLVVLDGAEIVGTYRLLRQEVAVRHGGFYTAGEFDIAPLLARKSGLRFLELGRSCVASAYRSKRTLELLWHGIWDYARAHRIDVMIGCASLEGTDPDRLAEPLGFLRQSARAPAEWSAAAHPGGAAAMGCGAAGEVDPRRAMRVLPPLLRAYLRLGAYVGEDAVVDRQFGTTDVLIVLPVARIQARYLRHYGDAGERFLG